MTRTERLKERIDEYLQSGGLWNPDLMEHDKVRELLIDCRETLAAQDVEKVADNDEPVTEEWLRSIGFEGHTADEDEGLYLRETDPDSRGREVHRSLSGKWSVSQHECGGIGLPRKTTRGQVRRLVEALGLYLLRSDHDGGG